jgi:hypothetical protein
MILGAEISRPLQWKPFKDEQFGGLYIGWLWFAVWLVPGSLATNMIKFHAATIRKDIDEHGQITFFDDRQTAG